ncbi:MAG: hypothetical protein N4A35_08875 [Flavobacteriales bacterium]|jgi:hypothetical protein|nr:hypothetical protein [Flavobacteriales bacterium]
MKTRLPLLFLFLSTLNINLAQKSENLFDFCFFKARNIQYVINKYSEKNVKIQALDSIRDIAFVSTEEGQLSMIYNYQLEDFTSITIFNACGKNEFTKAFNNDKFFKKTGNCITNLNDQTFSTRGKSAIDDEFSADVILYFSAKTPSLLIDMEDKNTNLICDVELLSKAGIYLNRMEFNLYYDDEIHPKARFANTEEATSTLIKQ